MLQTTQNLLIALSCLCVLLWAIVPPITFHSVKQSAPPYSRIVSLSPSITAMIIDLQSENTLVGVTRYHPPLTKTVTIVGSITNPNIETIIALRPDIILTSQEDAVTQKSELLRTTPIPCINLPAATSFAQLCKNYLTLAQLIHKEPLALQKIARYQAYRTLMMKTRDFADAIILLSYNPTIAVSDKSYISALFADAGIRNIIKSSQTRYPLLQEEYLFDSRAQVIIALSNELLPKKFLRFKKIVHIPYDGIYFYTPQHYCNSLDYIIAAYHKACLRQ